MQPPQSLKASMTASHFSVSSAFSGSGTTRPGVGFLRRRTSLTPYCSRSTSSTRSRKNAPLALLMSRRPIVFPARVSSRGANTFSPRSTLSVGSSSISPIKHLLFLLTNLLGRDAAAEVAPGQAGHGRREAARRAARDDDHNALGYRKLGVKRIVSRRLCGLAAGRNHAHARAFTTVHPWP